MIKVTRVKALAGFQLDVSFSDGTQGILDCAHIVAEEGPMVAPLRDPSYFARVFLEYGAPTWSNGFDMAPWSMKAEIEEAGPLRPAGVDAAE